MPAICQSPAVADPVDTADDQELLYGLFPYFGKGLDGILRVKADGFRPFHQLDHFDQLLTGLDVADVVLPAFEPLREINLA